MAPGPTPPIRRTPIIRPAISPAPRSRLLPGLGWVWRGVMRGATPTGVAATSISIIAEMRKSIEILIAVNTKVGGRGEGGRGDGGRWQHNPEHRKGVSYRDQGTAQKFNRASTNDAIKSREQF